MDEQLQKVEVAAKKSWGVIMAWIGGITALVGFVGTIGGGVAWFKTHHRQSSEYRAKMALAQSETQQKQYGAALGTYADILKEDPLDQSALDAQLNTAMQWAENFSVLVPEGKNEGDLSGPGLDEIFPVLTSGLTRVKGSRAADVQAHLGWAHFLNEKIAHREDDSVAVENWQDALLTDPKNAYANAMLGNYLLQSGGSLNEAAKDFELSTSSGRALPFVRRLQIGGFLYHEAPGSRAEMMRLVNQMRVAAEPLDPAMRHRILGWCFDPTVTDHADLAEALGALPFDDAWKTYLWLSPASSDESQDVQDLNQQFVHANLLEVSGDRAAALTEFRNIRKKLQARPGSLRDQVDAAIKRLSGT